MEGNEQIIQIDKIILHPNYNPSVTNLDYDVALIKLKEPITFNNDVRPVCLPTADFEPGTNCYVTGWGDTREGGNIAQVLIQMFYSFVGNVFTCIHESLHKHIDEEVVTAIY